MRKIDLKTQVIQKSVCARLMSDVDSGNALALREVLNEVIADGKPVLFLDLREVRRMDSAGIAVLVEVHDRMKNEGRQLGLVNTPPAVRDMLELLGVFEIYQDIEAGLKATKKVIATWQRLHDPTKPIE